MKHITVLLIMVAATMAISNYCVLPDCPTSFTCANYPFTTCDYAIAGGFTQTKSAVTGTV